MIINYDPDKVGKRIQQMRKAAGLTQMQAAEAAELSDRGYANIENGLVNMRVNTLVRISEMFGVTPNDILMDMPFDEETAREDIWKRLACCTEPQRETILQMIAMHLDLLGK